jgi:sugar diacid utilization regulator
MQNGEVSAARVRQEDFTRVAQALRAQASVLDRMLAEIVVGETNEPTRAGRSPEWRRMELVRSLLTGERVDMDGSELGYELSGEHVGVIARGAGAEEVLRGLAVKLDRRLLCVDCGEETVWAWLGGQHRLEMAALELVLSGDLREEVAFAVGEPARSFEGWRLTHRQAQAALVVVKRRPRRFTRYADVALLAVALKDEGLARALIAIYVEPLEDSRGGGQMLRETLRAYFAAERSASSAAAALGVDRKTVTSRLRTIEKRLGRSLHPCPAELEVALLLDELVPASARSEIPTVL